MNDTIPQQRRSVRHSSAVTDIAEAAKSARNSTDEAPRPTVDYAPAPQRPVLSPVNVLRLDQAELFLLELVRALIA